MTPVADREHRSTVVDIKQVNLSPVTLYGVIVSVFRTGKPSVLVSHVLYFHSLHGRAMMLIAWLLTGG